SHQLALLLGRLHRHKTHGRAANRLTTRFRVNRIVLVALDVSLHVFRRHQTNLVTKLRQLTCPIMRRGTRLHADQAGRQRRKELQHLTAPKLLPDDDLLGRINAVDLKHVLGDIQTPSAFAVLRLTRNSSRAGCSKDLRAFSPLRRCRIAASAAEKQKLQAISGRDVRARWTCLTFFAKLLSSLFVEHSREMPAFGAFVRDQRPKPTSRRYLQYFLHRRAAFLADWHINALASLITRHATTHFGRNRTGVFRVNTLESKLATLSEVSAAALRL